MRIRNASLADSALLLDWRNSETARINSFSDHVISKSEHENWLNAVLVDSRYCIYLISQNSEEIAVVTFYREMGLSFNVSININPLHRGKGLAKKALLLAESQLVRLYCDELETKVLILKAKILVKNTISRRLFESSLFKLANTEIDYLLMTKELKLIKKT
jgi:RimJ/RimL family protein N-acetyltransferase